MEVTSANRDSFAHNGLIIERRGAGAPLVLVHPSAGGLRSFDPILPYLGGFETWIYSRRGYAPSDPVRGTKTFAHDVDDLAAVIQFAGGTAHVLGASYGGTVALHAARAAVSGIQPPLIVFEPPLFAAGESLQRVLTRFRALLDANQLREAQRLFLAQVAQVPTVLLDALPDSEPVEEELHGCLGDLEALVADSQDVARWEHLELAVALLRGTETWDPMPQTLAALEAALPSVTTYPLRGQSHFATHTAPELFAQTVKDALSAQQ